MKRLILVAVVLLSGCATIKDEFNCTFGSPECSYEVAYKSCLAAAEGAPTPETVAIEKLRCDTQKAAIEAKRAADDAAEAAFMNSQPYSCIRNGQATLCN